eukprot:6212843-Pleurochrysis_carterae.AAC.1
MSRSRYLLQCLASILQLAVAATAVARRMSVKCGEGILLIKQTRPATPRAHDHTARTEAENPLDHGVAMC